MKAFEAVGLKELMRDLKALPDQLIKKDLKAGMKDVAVMGARIAKALAPVGKRRFGWRPTKMSALTTHKPGYLKTHIKAVTGKVKTWSTGEVVLGSAAVARPVKYGWAVESGHIIRGGRKSGRLSDTKREAIGRSSGKTTPALFMEKAAQVASSAAEQRLYNSLEEALKAVDL